MSHPEAFDCTYLFYTKNQALQDSVTAQARELQQASAGSSYILKHSIIKTRIPSWGMGGRGVKKGEWAITSGQTNLVFRSHTLFSFSFYLFQVLV